MKGQTVRLFDVWVLGPGMMVLATRPTWGPVARTFLFVSGALTVLYNARNYLRVARRKR